MDNTISTADATPGWERRRLELALIAAVAVLGFAVVWWLSGRTGLDVLKAAVALGGAALTAALLPRFPAAAVGIVFVLAAMSIVDINLTVGRMRMEQPAILALLFGTWWHRHELSLPSLRAIRWPLLAAAVYLGASALSSAFVAPDPDISLRLVLWTGISMLGGLGAYWLTASLRNQPIGWFAGTGVYMAIVGLSLGVVFYLVGPGTPLIYGPLSATPKMSGLAFEANLYASLLAATAFFAFERWREQRTWQWAAATGIILLGIGVGITRGAYIGLAIGAFLYMVIAWRRIGFSRWMGIALLAAVVATGAGMVVGAVLMDANVRNSHLAATDDEPLPPTTTSSDLDTLFYRLDRVRPAVDDFLTSPLVGTGLASLGQIHTLPNDELNYINIMFVATLHDSGLIGAIGLAAFGLLLVIRLWRSSSDPARAGPAAAYLGAMATLLVAYQATNAIHFAINWLIAGAALGLTVRLASDEQQAQIQTEP